MSKRHTVDACGQRHRIRESERTRGHARITLTRRLSQSIDKGDWRAQSEWRQVVDAVHVAKMERDLSYVEVYGVDARGRYYVLAEFGVEKGSP